MRSVKGNDLQLIAYPNPFSGQIMFMHRASCVVHRSLALKIYSIDGTLVRQISLRSTKHEARCTTRGTLGWGRDNYGRLVCAGIYYYEINADDRIVKINKIIKMR